MDISRRRFAATALAGTGVAVAGCLNSNSGNVEGELELEGESELPVPVAGDPDADVTVMVFKDFGCPACAKYTESIYPDIKSTYIEPGDIRYEFRDFPIPSSDEWSWEIASAARSVQDQGGDEAFWQFEENIYSEFNDGYSLEVIESTANDAGVDGEQVVTDTEDGAFRDELETEKERASNAGIEATPSVFVDGEQVEASYDAIESAIDDAL
ncbi:disulfide bond formation protein [Halostagnicola larsenii XH-48]|uniref:Disulfide bond formation protein n=1 Tax=Halostagnicola larsenii XH-48 TaxID=797299 RepID=W0JPF0_9EURY|nr:thioredoxin domain-containing protein [Halostagnicola larsenii]AHF99171.1 disulfide bond formation protein [Halostagnicola larsenii XH-48]